jgi:protein-S-isoprenylcysteine O-methyltransferase Ste14
MMTPYVIAAVLVSYASLLVELSLLHVPSVASSWRIWSPRDSLVSGYSTKYRRLFGLGRATKLLLFAVPLLVVYAVYLYPLVVTFVAPDPLGDYLFQPGAPTDGLAIGLVLGGRAIAIAAALTVRRQNAQTGDSFRLHTAGVFRWSRNPGLLGMYTFVIGLWAAMPSASMLAGILFYILYMDFKVRMEEDFLNNKFGAHYTEYRLRTGRYIP